MINVNRTILQVINNKLFAHIENYFVFDFLGEQNEGFNFKVPPTGFPTLLFCFGEKTNFFNHEQYTNESILVGQLTKHIVLHPKSGSKIFGINFKPYGFYNLYGESLKGLKNSAIESNHFFKTVDIEKIQQMLDGEEKYESIINQAEGMLLRNQKQVQYNNFFNEIVDIIVQNNGLSDPFQLIAGKSSVRNFQRYFHEVIGISPKDFCQVLRHKYILQLMYSNPKLKWNELVLGGYYYDYSHFQKDFLKFTDNKPIEYLPLKNPFAKELL